MDLTILKNFNNNTAVGLVENYLTEVEMQDLENELKILLNALQGPKETGSSYVIDDKNKAIKFLKDAKGLWLDNYYQEKRDNSAYFNCYKKFISLMNHLIEDQIYFNYFKKTNFDNTLLNYYTDQSYYQLHEDNCLFTTVFFTHIGEEQNFNGGDLFLQELNQTVNFKKNSLVIFPSFVRHEVTPVSMDLSKLKEDVVYPGRITLTTFYSQNVSEQTYQEYKNVENYENTFNRT